MIWQRILKIEERNFEWLEKGSVTPTLSTSLPCTLTHWNTGTLGQLCTLLLWTHNTLLHCICAWNWVIDRMISALLSVQHCGEDCMRKCSHAWSGSSADPWENSYPTLVNRLHKESASRPWRQIRLPIQRETLAAWERQHLLWCGVDCPHSCQSNC